MSAPGTFVSDVTEIRRRARQHLADGAVTKNYGGKAEDAIARRNVSHARTDLPDDPSNFIAENARDWRIPRIKRERFEHVAEVHARGFDVDQHFTWPAGGQRERREAQRVELAALAGLEAQRHRRIERLLHGGTSSRETLYVAGFATEGDFALAVVPQQFAPERRGIGLGSHRRQVDPAAGQVRILIKDDPE